MPKVVYVGPDAVGVTLELPEHGLVHFPRDEPVEVPADLAKSLIASGFVAPPSKKGQPDA